MPSVSFSVRQLKHEFISWNRLILIFGPSGVGKTSLCRALAQQLSIRLSKKYATSKLIEIDVQSLFSKYFGESGKVVSKLFDMVEAILQQEPQTFVCVLIEEVEGLASTRQHSVTSHEPQDALRVSYDYSET